MRTSKAILLILATALVGGCGGSKAVPAPSPTPTPSPAPSPVLAMFTDPTTGFSTHDVRDSDDQIVQFDTATNSLIWAADGERFGGYPVSDNFIAGTFQVRFGTKDGERRAYFTEKTSATICDISVLNGQLSINPTLATVPGS